MIPIVFTLADARRHFETNTGPCKFSKGHTARICHTLADAEHFSRTANADNFDPGDDPETYFHR